MLTSPSGQPDLQARLEGSGFDGGVQELDETRRLGERGCDVPTSFVYEI